MNTTEHFLAYAAEFAANHPERTYAKPTPSEAAFAVKLVNFGKSHQDVIDWVASRAERSNFAASLARGLAQYGSLTAGQVAAVRKIIAEDAAKAAAKPASTVNVAGAGFVSLGAALLKAKASGLKRPAIIFDTVCFKLAKDGGANSGSIYATGGRAYGSDYFGKINAAGDFQAARDCTPEIAASIKSICADPLGAIVAYGQKTGNCACCNRELTDPESVARGIGPICFERYFGG